MASEKQKIADNVFYVEDMTSLRYAIPFVKAAKRLLNISVPIAFLGKLKTGKYNAISTNISRMQAIFSENKLSLYDIQTDGLYADTVFCVENAVRGISYENLYSFQHGFDYTSREAINSSATYLVTEDHFKCQLEKKKREVIVQPIPVVFWDWDFHVDFLRTNGHDLSARSVSLFYPEAGLHDLFKQVYDYFHLQDYETYVKQRRKNQEVPESMSKTFYDDIWYPSESIFLPMLSDLCIGFGTSAYTDIVHLNRQFVDLAATSYARDYYKPQLDTFVCIEDDFYAELCKLDRSVVTMQEKLTNPCDDEKIFDFLRKVLKIG